MAVQYERGFLLPYDISFTNTGSSKGFTGDMPRSYYHSADDVSDTGSPDGFGGGSRAPTAQDTDNSMLREDPSAYTTYTTHQPSITNVNDNLIDDPPFLPRTHSYQPPASTRLALAPEIRHSPPETVSHSSGPFATSDFHIPPPGPDQSLDTSHAGTPLLVTDLYNQHNPSPSANQYVHPTLSQSPFTSPLNFQYRRDQVNRLTPLQQHNLNQHDPPARTEFVGPSMVSESHMYSIQTQQHQSQRGFNYSDRPHNYPHLLPPLQSSDYNTHPTYSDLYGPVQSNIQHYNMSSNQPGTSMPAMPPASSVDPPSRFPDAGDYLRQQLSLPPDQEVNLWALQSPAPGERPPHALPVLIKLAIYGSPKKKLTLKGIYEAIETRFEYYRKDKKEAWKHSIRHNLSLNKVFRRCSRPITEPGKGSYWELDVSNGEGYKRERKRRSKAARNAAQKNKTDEDVEEEEDVYDDDVSETGSNAESSVHEPMAMSGINPAPAGPARIQKRPYATGYRFTPYDLPPGSYQGPPPHPSQSFYSTVPSTAPGAPPTHVSGGSSSSSSTHSPTAAISDPPSQTRLGPGAVFPQRSNPFEHSNILAANRQALYGQIQSPVSPSSSHQATQSYEYHGTPSLSRQSSLSFSGLPPTPFQDQYGQNRSPASLDPYSTSQPHQGHGSQGHGQGQENQQYHGVYVMRYRSEASDTSGTTPYQQEGHDGA